MKTSIPINKIQVGKTKYKAIVGKYHVGAAPKIQLEMTNAGTGFGKYRVRIKAPFYAIERAATSEAQGLLYFKQDIAEVLDDAKKGEDVRRNARTISRREALRESELELSIESVVRWVNGRTFVEHVSSFHAALVKILPRNAVKDFVATSSIENVSLIAGRKNLLYQTMYLHDEALEALRVVHENKFLDISEFLVAVVNLYQLACPNGSQKELFNFIKQTHAVLVDAFDSHVGNLSTFQSATIGKHANTALMLVREIMKYDEHRPAFASVPGLENLVVPLKIAAEDNQLKNRLSSPPKKAAPKIQKV